jgi:predicted CxxxxCH...CXXCH cytochrome family protein
MRTRRLAIFVIALASCTFDSPEAQGPPPNAELIGGCAIECHGDDTSNAPPKSMSGSIETSSVAVGAHRAHLSVEPTWHRQVACADCHVVPDEVESPGHLDGDGRAEVKFDMIAGPGAVWDGTTCTTACHGSAAAGGAQPTPTWTRVDRSQSTCGSCHGVAPPAPHPPDTRCSRCHPTMEEDSTTFRDPASHINGIVEVVDPGATGGCTTCHGSETSSAPPMDLGGNAEKTLRGVGAHAAHLAPSTWHRAIQCTSCHVVPLTADALGHRDGDNVAEVKFTSLNPQGAYAAGTATCTNLYCHGNGRGNTGTASWVTPGALACGTCHSLNGTNMSGAHRKHIDRNVRCSQCHGSVVDANRNIINANLHINGAHEIRMALGLYSSTSHRCGGLLCHGPRDWFKRD